MTPIRRARRAGIIAAIATLPFAAAYRFALVYRVRAGYPKRHPPAWEPDAVGLAFEANEIPAGDGVRLHAWYMPAGPDPAPGVVLVHGWESSRDRTLPHAQVLHAIGMHVLTIDVRGHGANAPETLPMSVGEYALDTRAAVAALRARREVTTIGILGHSMGAAGSLVATAQDPDVRAVIAVAAPADPHRLTRQTFRLAKLPIPGVLAWPLAWLTTRVYLRPRGHSVASISATHAVRAIRVPVMLVHGTDDGVVPVSDLGRLAAARRAARPDAVTETLVVEGGRHSWLYEFPEYRAAIGRFLARELGGPLPPDEAARVAEAVPAVRLPDPERLVTLDEEPGGLRSLARIVRRNETSAPTRVNADPSGGLVEIAVPAVGPTTALATETTDR
ncbi:MAG TPA: alpha/beta fold hydrolase [Candidatus Limnocylindrales bacterium]|nr:alpha/beta fold hydrolase [Candidatus Limnocylindrales bacterium]